MAGYNKLRNTYTRIFLAFVILLVTLTLATLASTPPIGRDALTHHLALPKLYLEHGGIYEIPEIDFSYYPMNLDLLYTIPLYFHNDIIPKYIHCFFGLATAYLIYLFVKNRINKIYGLLGALFFLTIPVIVKLSITVYVDLGLIFFSCLALVQLIAWLENGKNANLVIAGVSCGLALGTKYNSLIVFLLLTLFIPYYYTGRKGKEDAKTAGEALKYTLVFIVIALAVSSGWLLRNYLWTGNPIYPLFDSILNIKFWGSNAVNSPVAPQSGYNIFAIRTVFYHENWFQIATLPIRIFFEGTDNNPQLFDGRLSPFLLLLPVLLLLFPASKGEKQRFPCKVFLSFIVLYFTLAAFSTVLRIRYLAPIIPPLAILSMFGLNNFIGYIKKNVIRNNKNNFIFLTATIIILIPNFVYLYHLFEEIDPLTFVSGRITREAYLTQHRSDYAVKSYANAHIPESAKILCFFLGRRGYYLDRSHKFAEPFTSSPITKIFKKQSLKEALQYLESQGFTHILLQEKLMSRTINVLPNGAEKKRWLVFFKQFTKKIYSANGYSLYKLSLM